MALVKYILSEARKENPLDTAANYNKQRQEIYNSLKNKNKVEDFFNNSTFNNLKMQYEELAKLPQELANIRITEPTQNHLFNFNGVNDNDAIQKLIAQAKSLQNVEDFNKYTELFNQLEQTNNFIQKDIRSKINSKNVFSISTKDYELMKLAILKAEKNNDIRAAKEAAKKYYSGLLGNLGETIGMIHGYKLISKELQKQLNEVGVKIEVSNAGDKVEGKRAVGDTMVSFVAQNGQIIGSISMSNKLTAKYGKSKTSQIKLRTTFPTQISGDAERKLYYNLFSLHGKGKNRRHDLYPNRQKDIIAFRRYLASVIMKENLFGAFSGDNVYYFNYGEYLYTMNDLLEFWTRENANLGSIPLASLPSHNKRVSIMNGALTEEDADKIINKQQILITYNLHIGNLNAALNL